MTKQSDRDEFLIIMAQEGVPLDVTRALMRAATTLHRLAEAECNGDDWRDPKGPWHYRAEKDVPTASCGDESGRVVMAWTRVTCSSCKGRRIEQRVSELCAKHGLKPVFNGDPRGAVLKIIVPSGRTNDWGQTGVCVP